jgi:hypothetical protein
MAQNYVLLESIELSQTAASVTFDNIPQSGYTDLKIVFSSRTASGGPQDTGVQFNADTNSANTTIRQIQGSGTAVASSGGAGNQTALSNGATDTASTFSNSEMYIPNYLGSDQKSFSVDSVTERNGNPAYITLRAGIWNGTAAISSLMFSQGASFAAGSSFSLYAIAAFGTTPVTAPFAEGGNIVANDGTYWYHAFLNSGTFTPFKALSCDYLVIAGGGAGGSSDNGSHGGGGGGAGGYLSSVGSSGGGASAGSVLSLTAQGYAVLVGAGGTTNANGTNTTFAGITATGGGKGGISGSGAGATGGSGGGGSSSSSPGAGGSATASPVQGFAGGAGQGGNNYVTGAGGGAGAAGGNGDSSNGGTSAGFGGAGKNTHSTWATATNTGVSGYYAGGGGSGSGQFANPPTNNISAGGGGKGAFTTGNVVATAGTANTGSGGGGSRESGTYTNSAVGGNGGSGIVIVRYAMV